MDWSRFIVLQILLGTCFANSLTNLFFQDERTTILNSLKTANLPTHERLLANIELAFKSTSEAGTTEEGVTESGTTEGIEPTGYTETTSGVSETEASTPSTGHPTGEVSETASATSTIAPTTEQVSSTTFGYTTTDGTSTTPECKDHDEVCTTSSECCAIADMSCWDHPSLDHPLCKCDLYFQWDEDNWKCYPMSLSEQMMMAAFMAFSSAIIVALIAFCIHSCKNCRSYRARMRYVREDRRNVTRRQHMRLPREQHNLSVFVLKDQQPDCPIKLPTYDEISAHQIIYTSAVTSPRVVPVSMSVCPPDYESLTDDILPPPVPARSMSTPSTSEVTPATIRIAEEVPRSNQ